MATREHPLAPPPGVQQAEQAIELARIWALDGAQHVTINVQLWNDPAAWGMMLVDFARHIAAAYSESGLDEDEALARLRAGFDAEWKHPS